VTEVFGIIRLSALIGLALLLAACAGQPIQRKDGSTSAKSFSVKNLAKGDIDSVCETHQQEVLASLKTLALKLYRRNPREWRKSGFASAEAASEALFAPLSNWAESELRKRDWQASLNDAWREDFGGDRVRALIDGLLVMVMASYGHQSEFFLLSELDAQKLYNSARNIEAVVWKLSNARAANGDLFLLTNSMDPRTPANLSFEREFGKMIAIQDTLAKIIEDKTNRAIRFGIVNLATLAFMPI
jgi:hypothetical protein